MANQAKSRGGSMTEATGERILETLEALLTTVRSSPLRLEPSSGVPSPGRRSPVESTPPATPGAPRTPAGSRSPVSDADMQCDGCESMSCLRELTSDEQLSSFNAEEFFAKHGMFKPRRCDAHPDAELSVSGAVGVCKAREGGQQCRKRCPQFAPLLGVKSKVTPKQLLLFWGRLATKESVSSASARAGISHTTATDLVKKLGRACLKAQDALPPFNRCCCDETFVGHSRKQAGALARGPRRRGYWFFSVTEKERGRGNGRTVWTLVRRRDAPTLEQAIRKRIVGSRAVVFSDQWKAYRNFHVCCRNLQVNHKQEWTNSRHGTTASSNGAENAHGVVKVTMRRMFNTFGKNSRDLRYHVGIATRIYNAGLFGGRLQAILTAVRDFYDEDAEDLESISSEESLEIYSETEPDEPVAVGTRTRSGDKKRPREVDVDREEIDVDDEETVEDDETPAEARMTTWKRGMNSLNPKFFVLGSVLTSCITMSIVETKEAWHVCTGDELIRASAEIPKKEQRLLITVWYADHWVLAVACRDQREIKVYDSCRTYARAKRKHALARVKRALNDRWGRRYVVVLKRSPQQGKESSSCAVFVARAALRAVGLNDEANRMSKAEMRRMWCCMKPEE